MCHHGYVPEAVKLSELPPQSGSDEVLERAASEPGNLPEVDDLGQFKKEIRVI